MGSEHVNDDNNKSILTQLGDHARSEQKDDARFERVARAEATPDELEALERAAEGDPDLSLRLEASRPLDSKAVDRIASRIAAAARNDVATDKVAPSTVDPKARAESAKSPKNVESSSIDSIDKPQLVEAKKSEVLRPKFGRRLVMIAGPLALAAALVLFITTSRGPTGPDLPIYSISASGEQAMRGPLGEATSRLHLTSKASHKQKQDDARFEILLRPATAPIGKVVAYAFTVTSKDADPEPLDAKVEIAPEGSVRITGAANVLDNATEIRVVLGAPTAIGKFDDAARRARGAGDAQVRVLSIAIDRD